MAESHDTEDGLGRVLELLGSISTGRGGKSTGGGPMPLADPYDFPGSLALMGAWEEYIWPECIPLREWLEWLDI